MKQHFVTLAHSLPIFVALVLGCLLGTAASAAVIAERTAANTTFWQPPGAPLSGSAGALQGADSAPSPELDHTAIAETLAVGEAFLLDQNYQRLRDGDISAWVALPLGPSDSQAFLLLGLAALIFVILAGRKLYQLTH